MHVRHNLFSPRSQLCQIAIANRLSNRLLQLAKNARYATYALGIWKDWVEVQFGKPSFILIG